MQQLWDKLGILDNNVRKNKQTSILKFKTQYTMIFFNTTFTLLSAISIAIGTFHSWERRRVRKRHIPLCLPDSCTSGPITGLPRVPLTGDKGYEDVGCGVWGELIGEPRIWWGWGEAPPTSWPGPSVVGNMKCGSPPNLRYASAAHSAT